MTCTRCKLHATCRSVCVPPTRGTNTDVLVVSDMPTPIGDRKGRAGVGRKAKMILGMLEDVGVKGAVYTHAVRCRKPEGKKPARSEVETCYKHLHQLIKKNKPKYVLLLGSTALQAITGEGGITKYRGKPFIKRGIVYLPTLHPSDVIKNPKHWGKLRKDIELFGKILEFGGIPKERDLNLRLILEKGEVDEMMENIHGLVSWDLETTGLYPWHKDAKINCIGICTEDTQWILPVEHRDSPFLDDWDWLLGVIQKIGSKFEDCLTVAHNGKFDVLWMLVHFKVRWPLHYDTMLAHCLIDENDFHSLDHLSRIHCDAPDYDIPLAAKTGDCPLEQLAEYCAHDIFYTRQLHFVMESEFKRDPQLKVIFTKMLMPLSDVYVDIENNGVFIDVPQMNEAEKVLRKMVGEAKETLSEYGNINWNSNPQLGKLLFEDLGLPVIKTTSSGNASCDESVLKALDHPVCSALLNYRKVSKQLDGFIEGWKPFLHRSRLHPSFRIVGARTGRTSCADPNLQQTPRDPRIRNLVTAPPGWLFVEVDLSQIEVRVVAELSQDRELLFAYRTGQDVHLRTALAMFHHGGEYELVFETAEQLLLRYGVNASQEALSAVRSVFELSGHTSTGKAILDAVSRSQRAYSSVRAAVSEHVLNPSQELLDAAVAYRNEIVQKPKTTRDALDLDDCVFLCAWSGAGEVQAINKEWKQHRTRAKALVFGLIYGMGWRTLIQSAKNDYDVELTEREAKAFRKLFFQLYADLEPWHEKQRKFVRRHGYVRSLSGRKRRLPDATKWGDSPQKGMAERQAINTPVQSFANDMNFMAMLEIREEFSRRKVVLTGTVHDSIHMWVRKKHIREVIPRILEIMSHPKMLDELGIKLGVPIEAEAEIGPWGSGKEYSEWLTTQ